MTNSANIATAAPVSKKRQSEVNAALHRLMNQASDAPADKQKAAWYIAMRGVIHAFEQKELHPTLDARFRQDCPRQFKDTHFRFQKETGTLPRPTRVAA
ncbi:MAG: hypothetical protein AAB449_02355 [Patescibacteria group bacterium]